MTYFAFEEFLFPTAPSSFRIVHQNNVRLFASPSMATKSQQLAPKGRIVSAIGTLHGENIHEQYEEIYNLFLRGAIGQLMLDEFIIYAYFTKFEIIGASGPKALEYKVEFSEALVYGGTQ